MELYSSGSLCWILCYNISQPGFKITSGRLALIKSQKNQNKQAPLFNLLLWGDELGGGWRCERGPSPHPYKVVTGMRHTFLLLLCASIVVPGTLLAVKNETGEQLRDFAGDGLENGNPAFLAQDATNSQSASATNRRPRQSFRQIGSRRGILDSPPWAAFPVGRRYTRRSLHAEALSMTPRRFRGFSIPVHLVRWSCLVPGTFNINAPGLHFRRSDCTLRGSGTGALGSGNGGTRLVKADRETERTSGVLYVGRGNPSVFLFLDQPCLGPR